MYIYVNMTYFQKCFQLMLMITINDIEGLVVVTDCITTGKLYLSQMLTCNDCQWISIYI